MKHFERLVVVVGFLTLLGLLWKFEPGTVWGLVSGVGWGFLIILPMQLCDHILNAVGWRYAFAEADAARVSFWQLVRVRVAGDGVNYLTPSATIAGEIIRPAMLGAHIPAHSRNSSVVVAKVAQSLGQAGFAMVGLLVLIPLRLGFLSGAQVWAGLGACAFIIVLVGAGMAGFCARRRDGSYLWRLREPLAGLREQTARYLRESPGRFALSCLFFLLGFAWGAWEVLVICYFLGIRIDALTALSVEVLSVLVDSIFIVVPAKIGTQEAGKTAIFAGLGLTASKGLAFGLVRHARELAWAAAGFALYAWDRRRRARAGGSGGSAGAGGTDFPTAGASRPAAAGCPLPEESAAPGD
ncbi:MAG: lysylphosphatidylglycerol synthase domain-containing protein [Elusimicrobia bacterium]|nr:lysylphosphatidylglycerol synthase domain-containing protein [Elusimicrobiota bacterium]